MIRKALPAWLTSSPHLLSPSTTTPARSASDTLLLLETGLTPVAVMSRRCRS